jgi:hypothetical protein
VSETWEKAGIEMTPAAVDTAMRSIPKARGAAARHRQGGTTVSEYEVRLYEPKERRALCFTRLTSAGEAFSMARRWQNARPECRVRVVATRAPRPVALASI